MGKFISWQDLCVLLTPKNAAPAPVPSYNLFSDAATETSANKSSAQHFFVVPSQHHISNECIRHIRSTPRDWSN